MSDRRLREDVEVRKFFDPTLKRFCSGAFRQGSAQVLGGAFAEIGR